MPASVSPTPTRNEPESVESANARAPMPPDATALQLPVIVVVSGLVSVTERYNVYARKMASRVDTLSVPRQRAPHAVILSSGSKNCGVGSRRTTSASSTEVTAKL
eukprot:Amastigsp_a1246_3.p4 type:complete len:105 gc:universal Amastigsp_a1246_3:994-680(-)